MTNKKADKLKEKIMYDLGEEIRAYLRDGKFKECEKAIYRAMYKYPHAAAPHNLLGIYLEKTGNHIEAMRHFRAACDLEPTYLPAEQNLIVYGTFCPGRKVCAFNLKDCDVKKTVKEGKSNDELF